MRLNKVSITEAEGVFNAKQVRLIDITPLYGFENNVKTSQIGHNLICLAEANGFEKVTVKLEGLSNLPITPEQLAASKESIYVSFIDFLGRFYFSDRTKSWELTCKASKVLIAKPTQNA